MQVTWGFVQAGLDVQTSAVCIAVIWFGLDGILLGFLLLTCTFISLLGFRLLLKSVDSLDDPILMLF